MKKTVAAVLLIALVVLVCFLYPKDKRSHFVSIRKNHFELNGNTFYPISVNYMAGSRADKNGIWMSPSKDYTFDIDQGYKSKDSSLMQLKADMDLIKEMGFNSVRIVGVDVSVEASGILSRNARLKNNRDTVFYFMPDNGNFNNYFNALEELFTIVNKAGLKIVLLNNVFHEKGATEEYLKMLTSRFSQDTVIMAYDLFNEPLYFDSIVKSKEDVYRIVKEWGAIVKKNAPNQLSTIGLEGVREVFRWDPNILDVDFLSMHPYEYEPEQVRNEIYWYSKNIKKPWIIGETAIPADNDSVPYELQKRFAQKTLKQAYNCGAMGYTWWQYKDVDWKNFYPNFMGVISRKGESRTKIPNIPINGTPKPLVEEFKKFDPGEKRDSCICLTNYYNYSQHNKFRVRGFLSDKRNRPIKDGVIIGWNQWWSHSYHTITKEDGSFELLGDFPFYHWMASASLYSMIRNDILPDTAKILKDAIPTVNIGRLKIKKLYL